MTALLEYLDPSTDSHIIFHSCVTFITNPTKSRQSKLVRIGTKVAVC